MVLLLIIIIDIFFIDSTILCQLTEYIWDVNANDHQSEM